MSLTLIPAPGSYQVQGNVLTSHGYCRVGLFTPARNTCFWHIRPQLSRQHIATSVISVAVAEVWQQLVGQRIRTDIRLWRR